ncbi:MAG TPA: hypothetical protein EYP21_10925 [Syntrophaceae bacterium]|nr:hypothetical protein [Syntrophaceae bacterium]
MDIWDLIAITGTSATVLGVFLTFYALINNRILRRESQATREILDRIDRGQQEARREMAEALKRIAELIVAEGERTRIAISGK